MGRITMCNVKGVTGSDEATENYHQAVPLSSILASFSLLFWIYGLQLYYFG